MRQQTKNILKNPKKYPLLNFVGIVLLSGLILFTAEAAQAKNESQKQNKEKSSPILSLEKVFSKLIKKVTGENQPQAMTTSTLTETRQVSIPLEKIGWHLISLPQEPINKNILLDRQTGNVDPDSIFNQAYLAGSDPRNKLFRLEPCVGYWTYNPSLYPSQSWYEIGVDSRQGPWWQAFWYLVEVPHTLNYTTNTDQPTADVRYLDISTCPEGQQGWILGGGFGGNPPEPYDPNVTTWEPTNIETGLWWGNCLPPEEPSEWFPTSSCSYPNARDQHLIVLPFVGFIPGDRYYSVSTSYDEPYCGRYPADTDSLTAGEGYWVDVGVHNVCMFVTEPAIDIEKYTNGQDADTPVGPIIRVGEPVYWGYEVKNTGELPLKDISVTDDKGVIIWPAEGDTDGDNILDIGETWVYQAEDTAEFGQYKNSATVSGRPIYLDMQVTDTDPSHYFGNPLGIEKSVNGFDADWADFAPQIPVGQPVVWEYWVVNRGTEPLTGIELNDSPLGKIDCPKDTLAPDEAMLCIKVGQAEVGPKKNWVVAGAETEAGEAVIDIDESYYEGIVKGILIEKRTNGFDADEPPGPYIKWGDPVQWDYIITNVSEERITHIQVTDGYRVDCFKDTLDPGGSMICTRMGTAELGQHENTAQVEGRSVTRIFTDEDVSHYFGYVDGIDIEKFTNDVDADSPAEAVKIPVGKEVTWKYIVTNTGNTFLFGIVVADWVPAPGLVVVVSCPKNYLYPGESMECERTGKAEAGPYENTGQVIARVVEGRVVKDKDLSHYEGVQSLIDIEKIGNGEDADYGWESIDIPVGQEIVYKFQVKNTGNESIKDIKVTDDQLGEIECPKNTLEPGESMECTRTGTAQRGLHRNTAEVTGSDPLGNTVSDSDSFYYKGVLLSLEKTTNGVNADKAPGIFVPIGETIRWEYKITNRSNRTIDIDMVWDDGLTRDYGKDPECPESRSLEPGESMTCWAEGDAKAGQQINHAVALSFDPVGGDLRAEDDNYYYGARSKIEIEKFTNGEDADEAPGPYIWPKFSPESEYKPVTWEYIVRNASNGPITNIAVTDEQIGLIECPKYTLAPGESMTCQANGEPIVGQYSNRATAVGQAGDTTVSESDLSHYFGVNPEIQIEKRTNGFDADEPTSAPSITVGQEVTWWYRVINTGNVELKVEIYDDKLERNVTTCPKDILKPGEVMNCFEKGAAVEGLYENKATAIGTDFSGLLYEGKNEDIDVSHYRGVRP